MNLTAAILLFVVQTEPPLEFQNQDSVRQASPQEMHKLLHEIADDLARSGPLAWLEHFSDDESFFMASDGKVVFPDYQSAKRFLHEFAPQVAKMELEWTDERVQLIDDNTALVAAAYQEVITEKSGAEKKFGGYFSGLAVRETSGWKLRHLHWSSPAEGSK